ncbi:LysM peptidoglycan-binding domain-containing protein [Hwanghaeella grinnelliae]|uniref:LysM peptidoglycan-binding domain-containing protein n=1 Tax=Hwanghaeella grinnelliae TaxID=2500179 RepID=A0A3S2VQF8_9PROT|nr:LysM peptidoglycan-binding domain-containing M23 family metallopeptidase [Hwanghaeella grinnelliae]RVU39239.1 LysM peptidoglycan-binding domain-containing protein [Hwanghaeella grinnelliae]
MVRDAETLYSIARAYGVSTRDLISANGLKPPYLLLKGQRLTIPASRVHRVRPGETVYGISRQYGVDMSQLVQRNNISPPFTIRVGQRLIIPGRVVEAQSVAAIPRQSTPEPEPVVRFETKLTDEERRKLAEEPLDAPLAVQPKRQAQTPQPQSQPALAPLAGGPRAPRQAGDRPAAPQVAAEPVPQRGFAVSADGFPRPRMKPEGLSQVTIAGPKIVPRPEARSKDTFLWPVQGRVISRFGPKAGGLHNDGVNIAAPRGTSVRAAENGVVVYAGSELKGFGNMVLVKHADGYVTAYAHTADVLVKRGDRVRRGQAIARVGSTGNVDRPQLHFEIRKGRKAINPQGRLGA